MLRSHTSYVVERSARAARPPAGDVSDTARLQPQYFSQSQQHTGSSDSRALLAQLDGVRLGALRGQYQSYEQGSQNSAYLEIVIALYFLVLQNITVAAALTGHIGTSNNQASGNLGNLDNEGSQNQYDSQYRQ